MVLSLGQHRWYRCAPIPDLTLQLGGREKKEDFRHSINPQGFRGAALLQGTKGLFEQIDITQQTHHGLRINPVLDRGVMRLPGRPAFMDNRYRPVGELPLVFPEVDEAIVAEIVSDWTGIPVGRMVTDELATVRNLPDMLQARVIGQTQALRQIAERVQTARAGLSDPKKPLGVFLLAGPSGVGKTETALAVAEALYGGEQNTIVINMSEYQEAHTVSGLKGAPPGYVGYGEGGVLTEAVRRRPYSVVLLDEIEKAHHDVHEMFFQVFDKGYMEDGDGRYIDFRNTTILLTSNAASELTASLCADASLAPDQEQLRHALAPELLKTFPAAFLGRVTVVPYRPLADDSLASIVRLHLERVVRRMADVHGIALTYDDAVVEYVVAHCLVQVTGARVLIGFIEQHILPRLASLWLDALSAKCTPTGVHVAIADAQAAPADAFAFGQSHTSDASTDHSPAVPVVPVGPAD